MSSLSTEPQPHHILVADDSWEIVHYLVDHLLPAAGFRAAYALDGPAALEYIRAAKPDLVLLDLNLPHMTGLDILEALSLEPTRPAVILITGYGSEKSAVTAFRLGVSDYLVKPFTSDEVIGAVRRALQLNDDQAAGPWRPAQSDLERRQRRTQSLLDIGQTLTSLTEASQIIDHTLRLAQLATDCDETQLWLLDAGGDWRQYGYQAGAAGVQLHHPPSRNTFCHRVQANHQPLRLSDVTAGLEVGAAQPAHALLYLPLRVERQLLGILGLHNLQAQHVFSAQDQSFLETISYFAANALQQARQLGQPPANHHQATCDLPTPTPVTQTIASNNQQEYMTSVTRSASHALLETLPPAAVAIAHSVLETIAHSHALPGDAFGHILGLEIEAAEGGRGVVSLEVKPHLLNPHGIAQGGVTYALADYACGLAAYTRLGVMNLVTQDMHLRYHGPARPGRLEARAEVVYTGTRTITTHCQVTQAAVLIASATATFAILTDAERQALT